MKTKIKFEYDSEVDAAYLRLASGRIVESEEVQPGVVVDYDAEARVVGIEILRFSRRFPKAGKSSARSSARRRA